MEALLLKLLEEIGKRGKSFSLYKRPNWRFLRSPPWRAKRVNRPIKHKPVLDTIKELGLKFESSTVKTVRGDRLERN